jgi:hypothetical protein
MRHVGAPWKALCGLVFAVTLSVAVPAHAGTLYSTGFEGPTYTTGNLAGQDGWAIFGSHTTLVENTLVKSGLQAVSVDGSGTGQSGPYRSDFSTGPLVSLSADIYIASSTSQSGWQFGGLGSGLAPFLGGVDLHPGGQVVAISSGYPVIGTFAYNTWNYFNILFDLNAQTYSVFENGIQLASNVAMCGDNSICAGAHVNSFGSGIFDTFGGGNDKGYIDNYSVSEVPEPSSLMLLGTGLAGFAGVIRRKLNR